MLYVRQREIENSNFLAPKKVSKSNFKKCENNNNDNLIQLINNLKRFGL